MRHLKKHDHNGRLHLIDIHSSEMREQFPEISLTEARLVLHGYDDQGYLMRGLDVTVAAWSAVGKGYRVAFLRWPGVRCVADLGYQWFANNRYRISGLLTGKQPCECSSSAQDNCER